MVQKGIIEEVITKYRVKVRVPKYDKVQTALGGTPTEDLADAIVKTLPGLEPIYMVGDVVIVDYENNELARPVVIGLLYRDVDTSNQLGIPRIDASIKKIESNITDIGKNNIITHARYSNDNGVSFTSIYDELNTFELNSGLQKYIACNNASIDNSTRDIIWSIMDKNGNDVTTNYSIETTITGKFNHTDIVESYVTNDYIIEVPVNFMGLDQLFISFKILKTKDLESNNIMLSTDKVPLGTIYGSYVGLYVSSEKDAPTYPKAYVWMLASQSSSSILESLITTHKNSSSGDINEIEIFNTNSSNNTLKINGTIDGGINFYTSAPTSANLNGIKICLLRTKPDKMYSGWLYLIEGEDSPGPGPTPGPTPVEDGLYYVVKDTANTKSTKVSSSTESSNDGLYYVVKDK